MASTRELFDKVTAAFNAHDRNKMAELTADTCVASGPGGMQAKGKQEVLEFNNVWLDAFPDARVEVEKIYVDGDVATEEGIFTGTHTGIFRTPMGDVPPTQKKVRGEYLGVNEFRDGKLVRQRLMFDRQQLMEQLGLAPAPAAAGRA
jgi:predicted ester cyclase